MESKKGSLFYAGDTAKFSFGQGKLFVVGARCYLDALTETIRAATVL